MAEITLTSHLNEYLQKKKINALTLDHPMKKVCCAGPPLPTVKTGKPSEPSAFDELTIDGISIFWQRSLQYSKPALCISLRSFLLMKNVFVYDPDTVCLCSGGQQDR